MYPQSLPTPRNLPSSKFFLVQQFSPTVILNINIVSRKTAFGLCCYSSIKPIMLFELGWFYFRNVVETQKGDSGQTIEFNFKTFYGHRKSWNITSVLLQSKAYSLTNFVSRSQFTWFYLILEKFYESKKFRLQRSYYCLSLVPFLECCL